MDAAGLRALQAPIKERYKSEPNTAYITLKAKGTLDDANIACKVETGRALAVAGLHPATGGSGLELCSGDMLLEALGGVRRASRSRRSRPRSISDASPARSRPKAIWISAARSASPRTRRSASRRSDCRFDIDTDAPQEKLDQLLKLTERYCVVYQTIRNGPPVAISMRRTPA